MAKRKGLSLKSLPYLMVFACGVGATIVFRAIAKVKTEPVEHLSNFSEYYVNQHDRHLSFV